ncbi:MAG: YceH family protein [Acidobacteriota bacterium]
MPRELDAVEIRVLGCLLEKEQTTPEYYPLTLNALVAACNQTSNRDPVMALEAADVQGALDRLHAEMLAWPREGGRARRWEHALDRRLGLDPKGKALLGALFLRGAQTVGELRARTERVVAWTSLGEVEGALRALATGEERLVVEVSRRPGQKEGRWVHTAGGPPVAEAAEPPAAEPLGERIARLEDRVSELSAKLAALLERFGET